MLTVFVEKRHWLRKTWRYPKIIVNLHMICKERRLREAAGGDRGKAERLRLGDLLSGAGRQEQEALCHAQVQEHA